MSADETTSYDVVPYESRPFRQTHPDNLATIATLLGMQPQPIARCRVLELGCAAGGNLIPMALGLPESEFTGLDFSARQINDGLQTINALGLTNIALRHASILDVGEDWGQFDYIICHGVYSWVPQEVQDRILEICCRNLAPNGVAYVSYNTYPGWHMRSMIRRMMLYHASHFDQPQIRIQESRALLQFLGESAPEDNSPYSALMKAELQHLSKSRDSYLFHEYLETCNEPLYFHEFIGRAESRALQYLGEADFSVMIPASFDPKVRETLRRLGRDTVHFEQYMDFVRNRMFRQTLLCQRDVKLNYRVSSDLIRCFHLASRAKPASAQPDITGKSPEQFKGTGKATLTTQDPAVKAAMAHLAQAWPSAVAFETLVDEVQKRLAPQPGPDEAERERDSRHLAGSLLQMYGSGSTQLLDLSLYPPQLPREIGVRPLASPLARYQAQRESRVTNLLHVDMQVDEFGRQVLLHLDGSRDRGELVEALAALVRQGTLTMRDKNGTIQEPEQVRRVLGTSLEKQLQLLHRSAVLMA